MNRFGNLVNQITLGLQCGFVVKICSKRNSSMRALPSEGRLRTKIFANRLSTS